MKAEVDSLPSMPEASASKKKREREKKKRKTKQASSVESRGGRWKWY